MPYISDLPNGNAVQNADLFVATRGNQTVVISGSQLANAAAIETRLTTLETSAVIPGTYVIPRITVNAQGRITAADSGTISIPTHISELIDDVGLAVNGNVTITPGTYTSPTLEIGLDGRIKTITNGSALPSGGTLGQVLVKTSDADGAAAWQTIAVGSGGGAAVTTPSAPFPRAAQFTDTSVYGRGATSTPAVITNSGSGIALHDTADTESAGFRTVLRPVPTAPTAAAPFEFIANIAVAEGVAQYGLDALAIADANGNVQFWGVNGGSSGRSGNGTASYWSNGSWTDGDYSVGSSADGSWFRIVVDDTTIKLYRGTDGDTWSLKVTYSLAAHGLGAITRYGFMVHRYGTGTGDVLTVDPAYSTEFPKADTSVSAPNWRVLMDPGTGYFVFAINKLEFLDSSNTVIPVTGGSYIYRTVDSSHTPDGAFDTDDTTYYSTASFGGQSSVGVEWFGYSFPAAVAVASIRMTPRPGSSGEEKQLPSIFKVQYSKDNINWTTAKEFYTTDVTPNNPRTYKLS